eukprot:11251746-Alexandrium_andersonii.AAC.1
MRCGQPQEYFALGGRLSWGAELPCRSSDAGPQGVGCSGDCRRGAVARATPPRAPLGKELPCRPSSSGPQ